MRRVSQQPESVQLAVSFLRPNQFTGPLGLHIFRSDISPVSTLDLDRNFNILAQAVSSRLLNNTIAGPFTVQGNTTLNGTLSVLGAAALSGPLTVQAGYGAGDVAFAVRNATGSVTGLRVSGDGSGALGNPPNQLVWNSAGQFTLTGNATLPFPPQVNTLAGLLDVALTGPAVGQALAWNGTAWTNQTIPSGKALATLSDVSLNAPQGGQLLGYDAQTAQWNNVAYPNLGALLDVTIANPQSDQILQYDSVTGKWTNQNPGSLTPPVDIGGMLVLNPDGTGYIGPDASNNLAWNANGIFYLQGNANIVGVGWALSTREPLELAIGPPTGPSSIDNTIYIKPGTAVGQVLTWTGGVWVAAAPAPGGITSIGPPGSDTTLTFTPSPITGAGTIALNLGSSNSWTAAVTQFAGGPVYFGNSSAGIGGQTVWNGPGGTGSLSWTMQNTVSAGQSVLTLFSNNFRGYFNAQAGTLTLGDSTVGNGLTTYAAGNVMSMQMKADGSGFIGNTGMGMNQMIRFGPTLGTVIGPVQQAYPVLTVASTTTNSLIKGGVFTGSIAQLALQTTAAGVAADAGWWVFDARSTGLQLVAATDAGGTGSTALVFNRTGAIVNNVTIGTSVQPVNLVVTGNIQPGIQALADVGAMTALTANQVLTWNGTRWINMAGGGGASLSANNVWTGMNTWQNQSAFNAVAVFNTPPLFSQGFQAILQPTYVSGGAGVNPQYQCFLPNGASDAEYLIDLTAASNEAYGTDGTDGTGNYQCELWLYSTQNWQGTVRWIFKQPDSPLPAITIFNTAMDYGSINWRGVNPATTGQPPPTSAWAEIGVQWDSATNTTLAEGVWYNNAVNMSAFPTLAGSNQWTGSNSYGSGYSYFSSPSATAAALYIQYPNFSIASGGIWYLGPSGWGSPTWRSGLIATAPQQWQISGPTTGNAGTGAANPGNFLLNLNNTLGAETMTLGTATYNNKLVVNGAVSALGLTDTGTLSVTGATTHGANVTISTGGLTVSAGGCSIAGGGSFSGSFNTSGGNWTFGNVVGFTAGLTAGAAGTNTGLTVNGQAGITIAAGATVTGFTNNSPLGITNPNGIVGITNGANAAAGKIGELMESNVSSVPLTSGTIANITSLSLTAGEWDAEAVFSVGGMSTGGTTYINIGTSTTSATFGPFGTYYTMSFASGGTTLATGTSFGCPVARYNVTATTTVYAVGGFANATGGTATGACYLRARRVR